MEDITKNEIRAILTILKSPETMYNANSLAKVLGLTPMGTLKIVKRLEKESILVARQVGQARIYRISETPYAQKYVDFLLAREKRQSPTIKHWVNELKKVNQTDMILLFGSVLRAKDPSDIDVLFVTDQRRFKKLKEEVHDLNKKNVKKIHPLYQSRKDIVENIRKRDKPLLNAIKGIIVKGEDMFVEVYHESRKE